jgi:putative addiction module killer protein
MEQLVETTKREIVFYTQSNGNIPFQQWLFTLSNTMRSIVLRRLENIRSGLLGDYKPIEDGIFEFRIHAGQGARFYFAFEGQKLILLLSGGDKGDQKKDIKKAKRYYADYKERKTKK